jgi:glycerol dehydrogenase-like iron-containing ADH family enzyme
MKSLMENGPHHLHGSSVALASIYVAKIYGKVRQMTRDQVARQLRLAINRMSMKKSGSSMKLLDHWQTRQSEIHEQLYMSVNATL